MRYRAGASRWCVLGLVLSCASVWSAADQPTWEQLQAQYDYDPEMPLQAVEEAPVDRGPLTVQTIRFGSVNGQTVPATLCAPKGVAKAPVILFLHGLGGSRQDAVRIAAPMLCPLGIAIMSIDAQYHGDRKVEGKQIFSADVPAMVGAYRQTIIDNRRALDYIGTRADLDAHRVVLVGASMGSIMGSIVTALDQRIKAAFLIVGGGDLVGLFGNSQIDAAKSLREAIGDLEPYRGALAFVEPTSFAAHIAPRPLHMVNGKDDQIVPASCGQALFDAAGEPKKIVWYEGGAMQGHVPPIDLLIRELRTFIEAQGLLQPAG